MRLHKENVILQRLLLRQLNGRPGVKMKKKYDVL